MSNSLQYQTLDSDEDLLHSLNEEIRLFVKDAAKLRVAVYQRQNVKADSIIN